MELKCSSQNYAWGKQGTDGMVAMLMQYSDPKFVPQEDIPYAELWMGTHPNGPSYLKDKDVSLEEYIKIHSYVLGTKVEEIFGTALPFLFKVLSVRKALSIQVHPNKVQAEKLHKEQPEIYKDANHKPELAIALTPFQALCGFRPLLEIKNNLRAIPELRLAVGENKVAYLTSCDKANNQKALKDCFANLMIQEPEIISEQLKKLLERLSYADETTRQHLHADLLEQLHADYPGDVGCFCIYLFNYITLQPGEAIYLAANEPHAYLSGDCVECMACSDNVIRAGLTPKMKDVETLVDMLSYICESPASKIFQATIEDECTEVFYPPIPDFAVAKITIPAGRRSYNIIPRSTASILIIANGKAEIPVSRSLKRGSVIFIAADESLLLKELCDCHPNLMFQAFVNIH